MRTFVVCVLMLGALALLSVPATVSAQKEKDKAKKEAKAGTIKIGEGKDGKFRFSVYDGDEKFLALSAPFASEKEAKEGIEHLKEVLAKAKIAPATSAKKVDKDKKEK